METNLLVAGFGGQGIMMLGKLLSHAACDSTRKNVTFFPSYGAEQRGGTANCYVVISDEPIGVPVGDVMDDLIVMNGPSLDRFIGVLKTGGRLFINSSIVKEKIMKEKIAREDVAVIKAPVTELALAMGSPKVLNVIMLGVYIGYTGILDEKIMEETLLQQLGKKQDLISLNKEAFHKGLESGKKQRRHQLGDI
ncbi:MAG: 2-oxoacid:acceptor oxidoreductase family protein [Synergistaceae bacterium]|jgi:2-oxoglutarate ferredoxin oxidoreductase subunit gamma|nr:2-oxoacid:acceptor oxidoreductase family protein [Synergistaceae bacterium]